MIPRDYITEWRAQAPWIADAQVEQDLVISKALVAIFSNSILNESLAFRGGTALYKLHLKPPARYSEDIDLVQVRAEPAGQVMEVLREVLNPWLGDPKYKQSEGRVTLSYRFASEEAQPIPLRLKVEINTREHFHVYGFIHKHFEVSSRWFNGQCEIKSYELNELLATKLRALYQRKKGRDLFDLAVGLDHGNVDAEKIVGCFKEYMDRGRHHVTSRQFADNLSVKLKDRNFAADIGPLLAPGYKWNLEAAAATVQDKLIKYLAN